MNLQDAFLNQVRVQKIPVTIYLVGGHQIKGTVKGFDAYIVMLEIGGKYSVVYKHAISTITPLKPVSFFKNEETASDVPEASQAAEPITEGEPKDNDKPVS